MAKTIEIKKLDVMQYAKISAVFGVIIGFILALFATALSGLLMGAYGAGAGAMLGVGLISLITIPIIYGIAGFIGGIIGAALYNIIASKVGGIRFTA